MWRRVIYPSSFYFALQPLMQNEKSRKCYIIWHQHPMLHHCLHHFCMPERFIYLWFVLREISSCGYSFRPCSEVFSIYTKRCIFSSCTPQGLHVLHDLINYLTRKGCLTSYSTMFYISVEKWCPVCVQRHFLVMFQYWTPTFIKIVQTLQICTWVNTFLVKHENQFCEIKSVFCNMPLSRISWERKEVALDLSSSLVLSALEC